MSLRFYRVIIVLALALGGCANKTVVEHYDECALAQPSFRAMIACGKQRRNTYCQAEKGCSADGNAFVAYGDSLVASVDRGEISEAEAQRKWIEFRSAQLNAHRQLAAQNAAAAAASRPRTCYRNGNYVNCY